jgi:hypothetical protein
VGKMSFRLSPEISKKLQDEALKMGEAAGETVTVSDLLRACIAEKFPQICARSRGEQAALGVLRDEVAVLSLRLSNLEQDIEKLVEILSGVVPLLSTREQVDELTDGIAAVIRATKER